MRKTTCHENCTDGLSNGSSLLQSDNPEGISGSVLIIVQPPGAGAQSHFRVIPEAKRVSVRLTGTVRLRGPLALTLWQILFWAWIISELGIIVLTRTRRSSGTVRDRGSIFVLWIVISSAIWAGSWYGEAHPHTIFGGAHWVGTASVAILAAGLAIRWTSIVSLGKSFSVNVAIHADQTLYRTGLYRVVRHPSYTGMLVLFAALGLRM